MAKKKKSKAAPKVEEMDEDFETEEFAVQDDEDEANDEEEAAPKAKKKKSSPKSSPKSKSGSSDGSVYKLIEVVGSSSKSWEHAAQVAVDRASKSLDDLRIAEVVDQDLKIEDGEIVAYRTKLRLSFKYRD